MKLKSVVSSIILVGSIMGAAQANELCTSQFKVGYTCESLPSGESVLRFNTRFLDDGAWFCQTITYANTGQNPAVCEHLASELNRAQTCTK